MKKVKATLHFTEAQTRLNAAQEEMSRSELDVVPYMVCNNARRSVVHNLKGFLVTNGEDVEKDVSVTELIQRCAKYNKKFAEIDLSQMHCANDLINDDYCLGVEKVKACLEIAALNAKIVDRLSNVGA